MLYRFVKKTFQAMNYLLCEPQHINSRPLLCSVFLVGSFICYYKTVK
jgi:hypothetical protein